MTTFYSPADRAEDWQQLLAKPNLHWKTGYSAKSLAYSWTEAREFPAEVAQALRDSGIPALQDTQFLLGFPEYDVPLPGGRRPSQNNVLVLTRSSQGLVTIAVEGKVSELFSLPIGKRSASPSPGEPERLTYLSDLMALERADLDGIGYQLLHRSTSAVIEAARFGATQAIMMVHSFSQPLDHFDDYINFAGLYNVQVVPNGVFLADNLGGIDFYLGWVLGDAEYL